MSVCARCGHALGVGRFCLNCGHRIGAPAPAPDEERRPGTAGQAVISPDTAVLTTRSYTAATERRTPRRPRPPWLPWLVGALALLLAVGLGVWLLVRGGDDADASGDVDPGASAVADRPSPDPTDATEPSPSPTEETTTATPATPTELAPRASVVVPATALPHEDIAGNPVSYGGNRLLDGLAETCWRMPGDGSGETLTFTLDGPTTLTSVGLINGYAKTAAADGLFLDWYAGNRRVLAVVWEFDDGTTVSQDLEETRDLQTVEVDVTTETVRLTLVSVSEPGIGLSGRDFTALSEVSLVGTPG